MGSSPTIARAILHGQEGACNICERGPGFLNTSGVLGSIRDRVAVEEFSEKGRRVYIKCKAGDRVVRGIKPGTFLIPSDDLTDPVAGVIAATTDDWKLLVLHGVSRTLRVDEGADTSFLHGLPELMEKWRNG